MGGILILFSMMVSMLLWMDLKHVFTLILALTTLFLGFLGGRDDYLKLKYRNTDGLAGRKKLLFQGFLGALLALYLLTRLLQNLLQIGPGLLHPLSKISSSSSPFKNMPPGFYLPFFKDPLFLFSGIFTF